LARFLALDWDHKQLQIVAATVGKGGAKIQQAVALAEEQSPNPGDAEALGALLKERLKAAGIAPAPAYFCIGRDRVILKEVRYPAVPEHEEPAIVRFQAIKEITDPPDEVVLDYAGIGAPAAAGDRRALVLVVRREMLNTYQSICDAAGLKLAGLTPRPFGLMACLQDTLAQGGSGEAPDAAVGVVAVTANWAEFAVGRNEQLIFTRPLSPGGNLLGEIRRNLSVYNGQSPTNPLRSLYLAGSSAHAELREKLQESLGIPVHFLDPFGGADREDLPAANRGAFTGAVGLLLLRGQSATLPINFVHPKQPKPPKDPNRSRYIAAAVAAVVLLGVGIFAGVMKLAEKERILDGLTLAKNGLDKQLLILEEEDKKVKRIGEWANTEIVWLDEIYDMVDRFPDSDGTRLTMFKGEPLPPKAANAKDKDLIARMELAGITGQTAAEVDNLVNHLIQDGYQPDMKILAPNRVGQEARQFPQKFTDKVDMKGKAPDKYQRVLKVPTEAELRRNMRSKGPARQMMNGLDDGGMGGEG
jgi:Tfp pilus assembly PilM family ATPase